ncbi:MAG: hypothetical protein V3V22_10460 [Methylococcales bacterium]
MIRLINLVIVIMLLFYPQLHAQTPDSQLNSAFNKGRFEMPGRDELQQVSNAFRQELSGQSTNHLWRALAIQRIVQDDLLFFQEATNNLSGRGLFAIHKGTGVNPWLLQAPHAKYDKDTGKIAALIFADGKFKAAMWNSVPRKTRVDNLSSAITADMAHLKGTYWQALTEVFARYSGTGRIIQLHGFRQSKRKSAAGRDSEIILSAGHYYPPQWVRETAQCLKKSMPGKISLYPYDVKELGATTNVQNHLLQAIGFKGFLHIEMSRPMRQELVKSQTLRQLLVSCIQ